tara:strand:+ start:2822 stop:3169 length:348 start_codon:yes stop_codon:yes gene_type:complete
MLKSLFNNNNMKPSSMERNVEGLITKYPGKIPVIIIDKDNVFHKTKFLIPNTYTIGMFMGVLRNHTEIKRSQAMFLFFDNILSPTNATIGELYEKYKNEEDLCLYGTVTLENTFG